MQRILPGRGIGPLVGDVGQPVVGLGGRDQAASVAEPILGQQVAEVADAVEAPAEIDDAVAVDHGAEGGSAVEGVADESHLAPILNMLDNVAQCPT